MWLHTGVYGHTLESLHWKLTLGEKSLAAPGKRTCISGALVQCSNQLSYIPTHLIGLLAGHQWSVGQLVGWCLPGCCLSDWPVGWSIHESLVSHWSVHLSLASACLFVVALISIVQEVVGQPYQFWKKRHEQPMISLLCLTLPFIRWALSLIARW